jgi:uptake hydrogenase large subunit
VTGPLSVETAIRIDVPLTQGGGNEAMITPRQTVGASRLLHGVAASAAPRLVETLFTLCSASQRIGCEAALAAAQSLTPTDALRRRWARAINAERVAELLRASVMDWPGAADRRAYGVPLRQALKAARSACEENCDEAAVHAALLQSASAIGVPLRADKAPGAWFALLWRDAERLAELAPFPAKADFLARGDAGQVHEAVRKGGAQFARTPHLPGRNVETGVFARRFDLLRRDAGLLAARLEARLIDVAEALDALKEPENSAPREGVVAMGSAAPGEGFAMVDSPRGFLCHRVELDSYGAIKNYDILAPTEWNFHPAGPFAATLSAARLDLGEPLWLIGVLAALFDPCAPCAIHFRETSNA